MIPCDVCKKDVRGDYRAMILRYPAQDNRQVTVCSPCHDKRITERYGGLAADVVTESDRHRDDPDL